MRFVDDEFLLLSRSGRVPLRPRAEPEHLVLMRAQAERVRSATRLRRRERARARVRLAVSRPVRSITSALDGAARGQSRQR
jgi:hypothetical protein